MNVAVFNKLFSELDMVSVLNVKKHGLLSKNVIVYVNSALFFRIKKYILQVEKIKYEIEGMIEQAWEYINSQKYEQASKIFDNILEVSDKSNKTYFGKFFICLVQNKESYQYFKRVIETKNDNIYDDYYRLYLSLYNELSDIEEDYIPLLELFRTPKKIVAFNESSYNGRYLSFLNKLNEKDYISAKKALEKCLEMKKDIFLDIFNILLDLVIKHQKDIKKAYDKQESELEAKRSIEFADAVKAKDLVRSKKALENILSFRNNDNKDNYIYYLFLELIETIEMVEKDITFEIMPVSYNYSNTKDNLHIFYEAISAGDFATALENGKKCRGKLLDNRQKSIKVNLYVILLEMLYSKLDERKNNIDNLYQTLISNIERGNYKHALALYNDNNYALKEYNGKLVNYLFNRLMNSGKEELVIDLDDFEESDDSVEEVIDDSIAEEKIIPYEENDVILNSEEVDFSREEKSLTGAQIGTALKSKTVQLVKPLNNKVMIFLRHNEPNNEYFHKYQVCLVNKKFEEAKTWLDLFSEMLNENHIKKRLDYYYYQINLGILENSHPEESLYQRKQVYFLAYNCILEGKYDDALIYLNYYNDTDQDNDIRGYLLLGRLYTLMKKYNKAIETYIKANAIAASPDAYYFLGELYYKKRKWADAIFCYLTYNEFYPRENPDVYLNLSECYKQMGKTDKVVKYLHIAEEINVFQKRGLYLKDRILKAEMIDKKKRERFLLNKENKGNISSLEN